MIFYPYKITAKNQNPPHFSLTWRPGGKDCLIFSAFSLSCTTKVYKKREQRILNLVLVGFFFILTARASERRALFRKSFTSLISRGICKNTKIPLGHNLHTHWEYFWHLHCVKFVKIWEKILQLKTNLAFSYTFPKKRKEKERKIWQFDGNFRLSNCSELPTGGKFSSVCLAMTGLSCNYKCR